MVIKIRKANLGDIDWIISQLKAFSKDYGTKKQLFGDEVYARSGMEELIKNHVVFVADKDSVGVIGFITGWSIPHPFNPGIKMLAETFWWVEEKSRKTRAGIMLLNAFTEFGKKTADWVTISKTAKSAINERSLLKRGYLPFEQNYLLEVE